MSLEHPPAREHNEQQQFLTERETANLLRVSARTLQRWRLTGDGPPFCAFGGRRLYARADLMSWALTQRRRSTSDPGNEAALAEDPPRRHRASHDALKSL